VGLAAIAATSWPFSSLALLAFLRLSRPQNVRRGALNGVLGAHAGGGPEQISWPESSAPCVVVSEATWRPLPPPSAPLLLTLIRLLLFVRILRVVRDMPK
jgi:hypothetical protein